MSDRQYLTNLADELITDYGYLSLDPDVIRASDFIEKVTCDLRLKGWSNSFTREELMAFIGKFDDVCLGTIYYQTHYVGTVINRATGKIFFPELARVYLAYFIRLRLKGG